MGSDWLMGKKGGYEVDPYGTLNPEQKSLLQALGPQLQSKIANGEDLYSGDFTAPLTQGESDIISRNSRLSALSDQRLADLISGQFDEQAFQDAVYKPLLKQYQEDILPQMQEQYAGSGGYWGSARADAVRGQYQDMQDTLAAERAKQLMANKQLSLQALTAAPGVASGNMAIQAVPRQISQYGLDQKYNDYVRTSNQNQQYVNQAMQFLNLSTKTSTYTPGKQGMIGTLGTIGGAALGTLIAPGVGTALGAQLGGSIAGSFDESGVGSSGGGGNMDLMSIFNSMGSGGSSTGSNAMTPGYSAGYKLSPSEMAQILKSAYYQ